jgi:hypothetical protein
MKNVQNIFFGISAVPKLELNDKLLKTLADKTINQRIAVTGVQPKLSVTLEKKKEAESFACSRTLGRIHTQTAAS